MVDEGAQGRPPYRFGVAAEVDRAISTATGAGRRAAEEGRDGGAWASLRTWWASRDAHPRDAWHRLLCRVGRHEVSGGQRVQLGTDAVFIQRSCRWCRARLQ